MPYRKCSKLINTTILTKLKEWFGKKLKIFEIILKESPSKEDFNKLNINFINYLHPIIFFTHLQMYFFKPLCLCHSGKYKRKRDVCCKSSAIQSKKRKKVCGKS